ncbi:hypothetical protein Dimus_015801 [Dionaea muscipula]
MDRGLPTPIQAPRRQIWPVLSDFMTVNLLRSSSNLASAHRRLLGSGSPSPASQVAASLCPLIAAAGAARRRPPLCLVVADRRSEGEGEVGWLTEKKEKSVV